MTTDEFLQSPDPRGDPVKSQYPQVSGVRLGDSSGGHMRIHVAAPFTERNLALSLRLRVCL
jgi:hypothetical protein